MSDLLDLLTTFVVSGDEAKLRADVASHLAAIQASAQRGDRSIVGRVEDVIRESPQKFFQFDKEGFATLSALGNEWCAGKFEIPSIEELKYRASQRQKPTSPSPVLRLFVLDGASPLTDIGSLQATSSPHSLFQVASQFNCLEAPVPRVVDVNEYFRDYTQGPRASISAWPATLLRHYAAPSATGARFIQSTDGDQIDLLRDACGPNAVRHGYFTGAGLDAAVIVSALESNFTKLRVGVHENAQVLLGYNWDGAVDSPAPSIAQVFTSTAAGGTYGAQSNLGQQGFISAATQLLRAAYLGTFLSAICLGKTRVVTTLIGGGVFSNPVPLIWEALTWAVEEVQKYISEDMDVFVNGRTLSEQINMDDAVLPTVRKLNGAVFVFNQSGLGKAMRG